MARIYLSPSTQQNNPYINGGSEEYYMNLLADELVPYLAANAISYTRNSPSMTAASSIRQANSGDYDLYLALHSNASNPNSAGENRGSIAFYYPTSREGRRAAEIFARNLKLIYPIPSLVKSMPIASLGEIAQSRAPAVLLELAYHDNLQDAVWIQQNLPQIASNLAYSLTQFFGIPFIVPITPFYGTVNIMSGSLRIREKPYTSAPTITNVYAGEKLEVLGAWQGWYSVNYNGILGYVNSAYIN